MRSIYSVFFSILFAITLSFFLLLPGLSQENKQSFQDTTLSIDQRVDDLVRRMTNDEKISQLMNGALAIDRLGIPAYNWWNEGLHGIMSPEKSTVFPQAIGLASSWNEKLLFDVASVVSDEARAIYHYSVRQNNRNIYRGITIWSPNINIFRDPRWGRGQETYGEDPFLTSRLAVNFVKGLQGDHPKYLKTVATPKHFAVHSGPDPLRHSFNARANLKDMYETYFPAFRSSILEGRAYSIMSAYNAINGHPASVSPLLQELIRDQWKFNGYIVSDCGAINDIFYHHRYTFGFFGLARAAAKAVVSGTDLNCGDAYNKLRTALDFGFIDEPAINVAVKRLMKARFLLGMFDADEQVPYAAIPISIVDRSEHRSLALQAARESIVLLKNEDKILPIDKTKVKKIAIIGPNSNNKEALLGNYHGIPPFVVTPYEGIVKEVGNAVEVLYEAGSGYTRHATYETIPSALLTPDQNSGQRGLKGEYFNNINLAGSPTLTRIDSTVGFEWGGGSPFDHFPNDYFSVRWSGFITVSKSGKYQIGTKSDDGIRLYIDDQLIINRWDDHSATVDLKEITFTAGVQHKIKIEYFERGGQAVAQLIWEQNSLFGRAIEVAKEADLAIVVLGISTEIEAEEDDRDDIVLPEVQERLLQAVYNTGTPVALVLINGGPISVAWANQNIPAIIEAWYPGQDGGTAIADVLFGNYNPAGRLPLTVYQSLDQVPHFEDYSMKGRTYRYFKEEPLFYFGHGLSFTQFQYSSLTINKNKISAGETIFAKVKVKNLGPLAGDEVAQLYLSHADSDGQTVPVRALQGFKRINLKVGEEKEVEFTLYPRQMAHVNQEGQHVVQNGHLSIFVGGGQPIGDHSSSGLKAQFEIVDGPQFLPL